MKPWQRPPASWAMILAKFALALNLFGIAVALWLLGF
jgi:hypothetical protein